jgi:hypothetical protein
LTEPCTCIVYVLASTRGCGSGVASDLSRNWHGGRHDVARPSWMWRYRYGVTRRGETTRGEAR